MRPPVLLNQPEGEMLEIIRNEVHEDLNTREKDIAIIKEWLRKQPHLPDEIEDIFLLNFLRGCSFSLEKCKKKLDMYYTMRSACPEFFTDRDITRPELMDVMGKGQYPMLPSLTPDGRRISVTRGLTDDYKANQIIDVYKIMMMLADIGLREETKGVAGHVFIFDTSKMQSSEILKMSPTLLKKFLICIQDAYPVKVKEVHIVNTLPIMNIILNMVKPLLKEKIRKRIFFHKNCTGLHEHFPLNILPTEYGGSNSSLKDLNKAWLEKLKEYGPWFKEQESFKANEDLRPGKPTNYDELFGIDGSFRQLTID